MIMMMMMMMMMMIMIIMIIIIVTIMILTVTMTKLRRNIGREKGQDIDGRYNLHNAMNLLSLYHNTNPYSLI